MSVVKSVLSCPWVALGTVRRGSSKLLGVEAGDGGAWCHGEGAGIVSNGCAQRRTYQLSAYCLLTYSMSLVSSWCEARRLWKLASVVPGPSSVASRRVLAASDHTHGLRTSSTAVALPTPFTHRPHPIAITTSDAFVQPEDTHDSRELHLGI